MNNEQWNHEYDIRTLRRWSAESFWDYRRARAGNLSHLEGIYFGKYIAFKAAAKIVSHR